MQKNSKKKEAKSKKSLFGKILTWVLGSFVGILLVVQVSGFITARSNFGVSSFFGYQSFVVLTGEVAAVREAIECGIHTENAEGMEVSHVVVPNPRKEIFDSLL